MLCGSMGPATQMWTASLKKLMRKSKKTAAQPHSNPSPETSKTSWQIKLTERCIRQLRKLPLEDCRAVNEALVSTLYAWGSPHENRGAGIRKLGSNFFECRAGLRLRLLFQPHSAERELIFFEVGNHDEIRRVLKKH